MASYLAAAAMVVLLAGCSTPSTAAEESASTHTSTPTGTLNASYTRQMCDRLKVAVEAKHLREAIAIARQMAASGYPSSPDDVTAIDPKIWVDAWALLDAYRHDDVRRYSFALGAMRDHCRKAH